MIPAQKSKWFKRLFSSYQRLYLWPRNFHSVHMAGEIDCTTDIPVLYIANHSSWWDGLIIFQLLEEFSSKEHYMMMEESQLLHYRFFRKLGAFSVNKESTSEVRQSLRYAKKLMANKEAVWMFPQGGIIHQEQRPFVFHKGAAFLLSQFQRAIVKPVSLHYSFNQYQRPTASVIFGEEFIIDSSRFNTQELTHSLQEILEEQVNYHRKMVIENIDYHGSTFFTPVLKKGQSTSDFMDALKKGFTKWKSYSS